MMQCVSRCPLPKKATQHMVLFACDGVHQCVMCHGVMCTCERVLWLGGAVGAGGKKKKRQTHSVGADVLSHFSPFIQSPSHWQLSSLCCLHHELCLCWVCWCLLHDVK